MDGNHLAALPSLETSHPPTEERKKTEPFLSEAIAAYKQ